MEQKTPATNGSLFTSCAFCFVFVTLAALAVMVMMVFPQQG